jgi:hypothetical protein
MVKDKKYKEHQIGKISARIHATCWVKYLLGEGQAFSSRLVVVFSGMQMLNLCT